MFAHFLSSPRLIWHLTLMKTLILFKTTLIMWGFSMIYIYQLRGSCIIFFTQVNFEFDTDEDLSIRDFSMIYIWRLSASFFFTQVNFEFDTDEDLLAVDSSLSNEVGSKIDSIHYILSLDWSLYQNIIYAGFFLLEVRSFYPHSIHLYSFPILPLPQIQDFPRGRKIAPPPPAFRKIGDRLLTKIGRGKGQRFPPALVSSKRGKDGYTFRQVEPNGQQLGKIFKKLKIQKIPVLWCLCHVKVIPFLLKTHDIL